VATGCSASSGIACTKNKSISWQRCYCANILFNHGTQAGKNRLIPDAQPDPVASPHPGSSGAAQDLQLPPAPQPDIAASINLLKCAWCCLQSPMLHVHWGQNANIQDGKRTNVIHVNALGAEKREEKVKIYVSKSVTVQTTFCFT
jgi:hypothetical protein